MPLPLLLDSGILAQALRPNQQENRLLVVALFRLLDDPRFQVFIPEVIDYELRRKLLHLGNRKHQGLKWAREALLNLDAFVSVGYIPLTTEVMRLAARLWAQTRAQGQSRGTEDSLDVDVILAAQARQAGGCIVTLNEKHFRNIADVFDWRPFA